MNFDTLFPTAELMIKNTDNNNIYKIKIEDLLANEKYIEKWRHNRPLEEQIVKNIVSYISNNKNIVIFTFNLAWCNKTKKLYIYDGYHRYNAILLIKNNLTLLMNKIPVFYLIKNKYIILDILFCENIDSDKSNEQIKLNFQSINQATPVSELYTGDNDEIKLKIIENVINHYYVKYKAHASTATIRGPKMGFFTKDVLTNLLIHIYDKCKIKSQEELQTKMNLLDINIKNELEAYNKQHKSINLTKSSKSGLYIFMYNLDRIKNCVKKYL